MTEASSSPRDLPGRRRPATLAGGLLFVGGAVAAVAVHPAFFLVAALGAFGPALLREAGLLRDEDEFQRGAAASAAGHGYYAGGLFVTAVLVARGWSRGNAPDREAEVWLMALAVMLGARFMSYAARFWDVQKAAFRILLGFGTFWLLFVILSHGTEPKALAAEALAVPAPFFALAALSQRFPRSVGAILVALAIAGLFFFHVFTPRPQVLGSVAVVLFLLLPLALTGLGLLRRKPGRDDEP